MERYLEDLSNGHLQSYRFLLSQLGDPKIIACNRLVSADQSGQKNNNGKMTTIFFRIYFY